MSNRTAGGVAVAALTIAAMMVLSGCTADGSRADASPSARLAAEITAILSERLQS